MYFNWLVAMLGRLRRGVDLGINNGFGFIGFEFDVKLRCVCINV